MSKYLFLISCLAFFFYACESNKVFEKHTDPSGNLEWTKEEVVEFDVNIEDIDTKYNVILALRYAKGFMYTTLPVEVKRTAPGGEVEVNQHVFNARNDDGTYNGEGAGDIWDLEEVYKDSTRFPEKGTYHYEIRQISKVDKLHMVMEVGLIVEKTEPAIGQ